MVEGTAQARVKRALATKTMPAGQSFEYKIGDIVDFHRTASTKDASSWKGPAKVIDNTNITRGTLTIRYQRDMPIEVRLQDVRRHLDYFCFLAGQFSPLDPGADKWAHLRAVVDGAQQGKPTCIGMAFTTQGWQVLPHKSERPEASMSWLAHFATTTLQLHNVGAVIYGRGSYT